MLAEEGHLASVERILNADATKSDKIRALNRMGMARADIARALGTRYQFVRNVLVNDERRAASQPSPDPRIARITRGMTTKSAKIRALDAAGFSRSRIADALGVRYQHVRNVLANAARIPGGASAPVDEPGGLTDTPHDGSHPTPSWTVLGSGGNVAIPRALTEALDIGEGDDVLVEVADDELRLYSRTTAIKRVQELVAKRIPAGVSLVDELFAERRREARREADRA